MLFSSLPIGGIGGAVVSISIAKLKGVIVIMCIDIQYMHVIYTLNAMNKIKEFKKTLLCCF